MAADFPTSEKNNEMLVKCDMSWVRQCHIQKAILIIGILNQKLNLIVLITLIIAHWFEGGLIPTLDSDFDLQESLDTKHSPQGLTYK